MQVLDCKDIKMVDGGWGAQHYTLVTTVPVFTAIGWFGSRGASPAAALTGAVVGLVLSGIVDGAVSD